MILRNMLPSAVLKMEAVYFCDILTSIYQTVTTVTYPVDGSADLHSRANGKSFS